MCVTCYTPDPREVRLMQWLEKRQPCWAAPLLALLDETSEVSIEAAQAAWRKVFQ
jgi:hypothetical protein